MTKPLEHYLDLLHATYEAQGRAVIAKVPTPGEPYLLNGVLRYRKDQAVWTDYTGFMAAGGRAIVLEAKLSRTSKPSFPLSALQPIQRVRLRQAANAGAISVLYIRHVGSHLTITDYLLPALPGAVLMFGGQLQGVKSLRWDNIQRWKVPTNRTWLDAVVEGRCAEYRWGGWGSIDGSLSSAPEVS